MTVAPPWTAPPWTGLRSLTSGWSMPMVTDASRWPLMQAADPTLDMFDVEQRLDAVRAVAAASPGALALAFDTNLGPVAAPELAMELGLVPYELDGTVLSAICPDDHPIAVLVWEQARTVGLGRGVARFTIEPTIPMKLLIVDLVDDFGVFLAIAGEPADQTSDPAARAAAALAPRSFVVREDDVSTILSVDERVEVLLGWSPAELVGRTAAELVHPDDKERAVSFWVSTLAARNIETRQRLRYESADGSWRWFEVHQVNRLQDPDHGYVEAEFFDVDGEMAALDRLRAGEVQFRTLTESLPVGVVQVDAEGRTVYTNRWIRELTGVEDLLSSMRLDRAAVHPDDRRELSDAFLACVEGGVGQDLDVRLRNAVLGTERVCRMRVRSLIHDGGIDGAIASIEDITETLNVQRALRRQARSDELTGLPNRREMIDWLAGQLGVSQAGGAPPTAVVFIDLDGFKLINDALGHEGGDEMLVEVARRLEAAVRPGDLVARFGGDEFVVVCPAVARPSDVSLIARRLLDFVERVRPRPDAVRATEADPSLSLSISASLGIAIDDPAHPSDAATLLREADEAMYRAKSAGGGRVEFFVRR